MKPNDCAKLEKDYSFKRSYLNRTPWWKTLLIVPPICFLFVGLAGILYLFHYDQLISIYLVPYLILFIIGTIWLKTIKKHIQKNIIAKAKSFLVCIAKPIGEKDGYVWGAFVNDSHRYNKHYINNIVKGISLDSLSQEEQALSKKQVVLVHDEAGTDFYVKAYKTNEANKQYSGWREEEMFPVLYIDDKYTFIINKKDFSYYSS